MISKTFKLNSKDFTKYAHKSGLSVAYKSIAGLASKYTLDGTLHDDVLTSKATYKRRMNPVVPEIAKQILAEYRTPHVYLTIPDIATGVDKTVLCKTSPANVEVALVQQGNATYWQLDDLVFEEM